MLLHNNTSLCILVDTSAQKAVSLISLRSNAGKNKYHNCQKAISNTVKKISLCNAKFANTVTLVAPSTYVI
jgi:hypothetical protein